MNLIEIDIISAEPLQTQIDLAKNGLARKAFSVRIARPHFAVDLRGDHDLAALGVFLHRAAKKFFAGAERIDVGRVVEIDPGFERALVKRLRGFFVQRPRMCTASAVRVRHRAKADARDF